jgi:hypothetical protein
MEVDKGSLSVAFQILSLILPDSAGEDGLSGLLVCVNSCLRQRGACERSLKWTALQRNWRAVSLHKVKEAYSLIRVWQDLDLNPDRALSIGVCAK